MSPDEDSAPPNTAPVGYGCPPEHSRFKKGQSGNPSGKRKNKPKPKPKPTKMQDDLEVVLSQPLTMTLHGKRVTVSARQALFQKLLAMALDGDVSAARLLLKSKPENDNVHVQQGDLDELSAAEEAVIARLKERQEGRAGEGEDDA
jgi:hypothetical protein